MNLWVNLRHLEEKSVSVAGEIPATELELETRDEMIRANQPVVFALEVQRLEHSLLVRGRLQLVLDCNCVRCLKPFSHVVDLADWSCHISLEGEEKAVVVNDCVDLTPYVREDIFLALPQHPLCDPECGGLARAARAPGMTAGEAAPREGNASVWSPLDKLKL